MAVGVRAWSTTAASNGAADSNINFAEGQSPPSLNNSARALMAAVKALYQTIGGGITYGGTGNTYTATNSTPGVWSSYAEGDFIGFEPNATNSGAATLNVDGLGAKSIVKGVSTAVASGDLVQGAFYLLRYDGTNLQIVGGPSATNQPLDATLTAFAGLTTADDRMLDFTGVDTMAVVTYATVASNIGAVTTTGAQTVAGAKTFSDDAVWNQNSGSLPAPVTASIHQLGEADGVGLAVQYDTFGGAVNLIARKANNTNASKSALASGDTILAIATRGYGATGYSSGSRTVLGFNASEAWSDSAQGAHLRITTTPAGGTSSAVTHRVGDVTSDIEVGYRGTPQVLTGAAADYTLIASDAGKQLYHTDAGTDTWTIPANSAVPFPIGTVIRGINGPGAGVLTIAITTDTLQRTDGVAGTGSRSIAASSSFALEKLTSTTWGIVGTGMS